MLTDGDESFATGNEGDVHPGICEGCPVETADGPGTDDCCFHDSSVPLVSAYAETMACSTDSLA